MKNQKFLKGGFRVVDDKIIFMGNPFGPEYIVTKKEKEELISFNSNMKYSAIFTSSFMYYNFSVFYNIVYSLIAITLLLLIVHLRYKKLQISPHPKISKFSYIINDYKNTTTKDFTISFLGLSMLLFLTFLLCIYFVEKSSNIIVLVILIFLDIFGFYIFLSRLYYVARNGFFK